MPLMEKKPQSSSIAVAADRWHHRWASRRWRRRDAVPAFDGTVSCVRDRRVNREVERLDGDEPHDAYRGQDTARNPQGPGREDAKEEDDDGEADAR